MISRVPDEDFLLEEAAKLTTRQLTHGGNWRGYSIEALCECYSINIRIEGVGLFKSCYPVGSEVTRFEKEFRLCLKLINRTKWERLRAFWHVLRKGRDPDYPELFHSWVFIYLDGRTIDGRLYV